MFVVQTVEIARATRVGVARAGRVDSRSKIDMKRKEQDLGGKGSLYTFSRVALVGVGEAGAFPDSENFGVDLVMDGANCANAANLGQTVEMGKWGKLEV